MQFRKSGIVASAAVAAALMATPVLAAPEGGGRMGGSAHFSGGGGAQVSAGARSFSSAGPSFRASSGSSQQFASVRSGGNWSGRDGSRHRRHGFGGFGAGFAAGALIGSAPYSYGYSDPYYYDDYAYDDGYYGDAYAAAPEYSGGDAQSCALRYRSYDPASGTYLGYDGIRHPCP
jgi:hypothetical protein